ncbi:uncharacterized protein EI90DRAFT_3158750, partial [Cantharellus anzutake]|uniref:uncharacterized protein n=1 Tax=Cantharellus anzutake TaxID=1750568 RepID=UPI001902CA1F
MHPTSLTSSGLHRARGWMLGPKRNSAQRFHGEEAGCYVPFSFRRIKYSISRILIPQRLSFNLPFAPMESHMSRPICVNYSRLEAVAVQRAMQDPSAFRILLFDDCVVKFNDSITKLIPRRSSTRQHLKALRMHHAFKMFSGTSVGAICVQYHLCNGARQPSNQDR